ncbi:MULTISPECIES: hypothetical protein [Micrococcaceae]|uniref:hypothetical protein n=1 Tax=Micrococcaceae TaxID=1268 RepID=UPI00254F7D59|nr:hypothetical protein [Arthrobacter sp. fls2-241-R2A-172]
MVDRSGRTWKWWKRNDGLDAGELTSFAAEESPTPLHEFLGVEPQGDELPAAEVFEPGSSSGTPLYQETRTMYFTDSGHDETEQEESIMSSLDDAMKQLLSIEGATGAAIVDYSSGMALAQGGNPGFDLGVAAAGNSNVVSSKLRTMADLKLDSNIEDILITLGTQYHLINVLNSEGSKGLFVYLVLDRTYANLALARHKLSSISKGVSI